MGARNWVSMLCLSEAIGHKLYDRLLQCAATAQTQRWIAAECGREGLLENSKDGGLKHLTTTKEVEYAGFISISFGSVNFASSFS
ncbi:hypothetical protein NSMM_540052 [Nitrosomonas mobilis]|uniref:Uncharacterized protein n=1 Tax=Nitrosomonas mobilis TaxID=51642 RepID=A0A1G5SJB5_9PROT|nr:hypothetical protein NSMM_540052 [Nitrosomonas mobilis]